MFKISNFSDDANCPNSSPVHQRNSQSFPTFNPQGVHRAIEHDPVMVLGSANAVVRPSPAHLLRAFVTNEITWTSHSKPFQRLRFLLQNKSQSSAETHSPQTTNIPNWIIDPKNRRYKSSPATFATKSQGCDCPASHCESAQPPPRRTTRASPFEECERPRKGSVSWNQTGWKDLRNMNKANMIST